MRRARIRCGPGATALLVLAAFAAPPARAAEADRLAWLAGSWAGTKEGVASEEHWTSPAGEAACSECTRTSPERS